MLSCSDAIRIWSESDDATVLALAWMSGFRRVLVVRAGAQSSSGKLSRADAESPDSPDTVNEDCGFGPFRVFPVLATVFGGHIEFVGKEL